MKNTKSKSLNMKPREKFVMYGGDSLSEIELLAIYLQTGSKNKSVTLLATQLIERYGTINNLIEQTLTELKSNHGIGDVKAIKIKALYYMYNKVNIKYINKEKVDCAKDIYNHVKQFENKKEENLYIVALNTNNEVIGIRHIFKGTISSINISFREIFQEALLLNAKSICLIHNHPSGNTHPSLPDIKVTKDIIEFGSILDLKVIDHIIISNNKYFSLRENDIVEF